MFKGLLAALAALFVAGQAQAKPPIWIVRDADSEIVLFGSIHILPPNIDWKPPALTKALARADDVWFELPMDQASETEVAGLASAKGILPADQSLSALLSPDGAARLARTNARYGLSPAFVERLEPWFAEVLLAGAEFRQAGANADSGVEKAVSAAVPPTAQRRAFETPAEQIALFDGAPLPDQVASLEETLQEMEDKPGSYNELVADWMAGDLAALEREALGPLRAAAPGLYARLVTERNERWIATLRERLKGSGRTVVVVGVGHLAGPDGLPARLRALGYSVEGP
jgi:uncharacterized protein YbaP (TraB family)